MIHIVDYGLGNIRALMTSFERLGVVAIRAQSASDLTGATKLILPGVGAFDSALERLNKSGMRDVLDRLVIEQRTPVLGICVGMQMMADSSEEGSMPGLSWIPGQVKQLSTKTEFRDLPMPHMGWNDVSPASRTPLFSGIELDSRFYFLHSYYFKVYSKEVIAAVTNYGIDFASAVSLGNVYGVQFHPEKSHHFGAHLLKNFANL